MVGNVASSNKKAVSGSSPINGYVSIESGKFVDNSLRISQSLDDAARFVCQVLGYSLGDVYQMDCFQFHRELLVAEQHQDSERKNLEKWKKK
jgi:hypothetical protein